ncbi:hypothetical protein CW745_15430 [Psychromonas sp. psych-6C06]|uniref:tetratricopeptide repeat protein n=1 Tax=Psychromonas sp. psych-6C06 TaxID=2058089 RepID=UPI000C349C00|nr:tetratricopeptide repeat protein [Psychromonas sp. psych-6C06]PKF60335.1 hypothetical protein CW745_15430 [Psychromonas sp. psych-6C06]
MSFIKKIFSGRSNKKNKQASKEVEPSDVKKTETNANEAVSSDAESQEALIKVHDEYGREMQIGKQEWLNNVLLGNLDKNRDNPDELYNLIISALNDGFEAHIQDASARLYEIDPIKERGACIHGIVLMKNKQLDEAEKVLKETMSIVGQSGVLLTNLAKVYAERNEHALAETVLWSALEADPNQDNGLDWYAVIHHERRGEAAYIEALRKVSKLPGAWRPQLWLAREALKKGEKQVALSFYEEIFRILQQPDSQVLQQISGDLGQSGHIQEIITVVLPHFVIEHHGFSVANNLIKAFVELKRYPEAKSLVEALFAYNRPDWKEGLTYWMTELDNLMGDYGPVEDKEPPKLALMPVNQPIWLHKLNATEHIIPQKSEKPFTILTTSGSCSIAENHDQSMKQKTNEEGSICRGIALSFCDKLNMESSAQASMLVPIIEDAGFVFFGQRYEESWATQLVNHSPCDLIILPHLYAESSPWKLELRLFDPADTSLVKTITKEFSADKPSQALKELIEETYHYITDNYAINIADSSPNLAQISPQLFAHYVDANEVCLALSLACNVEDGASTLYGERNIFDKLLTLALEEPNSDIHKLMLVSAMSKNKAYGSTIYQEYEKKVKKLVATQHSGCDTSKVLEKALCDIYGNKDEEDRLGVPTS